MKKIIYIGEDTASYHLFFNGVSSSDTISFFNLTDFNQAVLSATDIEKINTAEHIIFSRDIDWKTLKIADLVIQHKIPYSYYADDNYFILNRIVPSKKVNRFLSNADAFISTTSTMNNFFKNMGSQYDKKLIQLDLDVDIPRKPTPKKTLSKKILNIGFLGTGKNWLYPDVMQDLTDNLPNYKLNIYAPLSLCKLLRKNPIADSITLIEFSFIKKYSDFVEAIKGFNLDFILQPADLEDQNYQFKNLNSLLLPYHCNCLTLFCDNAPYDSIKKQGLNELLARDNKFSNTITKILNDNDKRIALTEKLFSFVENNFSANDNIGTLQNSLCFKEYSAEILPKYLKELRFRKIEKIYHRLRRSFYRKFNANQQQQL